MVGDGINDAPAPARIGGYREGLATVETADIVLMADRLENKRSA